MRTESETFSSRERDALPRRSRARASPKRSTLDLPSAQYNAQRLWPDPNRGGQTELTRRAGRRCRWVPTRCLSRRACHR
eukprot:6302087-Prymnesium_polylepis.1